MPSDPQGFLHVQLRLFYFVFLHTSTKYSVIIIRLLLWHSTFSNFILNICKKIEYFKFFILLFYASSCTYSHSRKFITKFYFSMFNHMKNKSSEEFFSKTWRWFTFYFKINNRSKIFKIKNRTVNTHTPPWYLVQIFQTLLWTFIYIYYLLEN